MRKEYDFSNAMPNPYVKKLKRQVELDRELALSLAEADRGETFPIEQLEKEVAEKFANGYYGKK